MSVEVEGTETETPIVPPPKAAAAAAPPKVTPAATSSADDRTVPFNRFQVKVAELKDATASLTAAKAEIATLAARATAAESAAADLAAAREEVGLVRLGLLDPEAITVARAFYGGLPAESKPASLVDYVTAMKAEGATPPKALAVYLTPPAAVVVAPAATPTATKLPAPKVAATGTLPAATQGVTADALRALRESAQRTKDPGDWAKFKAAVDVAQAAKRAGG